jgi:hypothetical protein
MLQFRRVPIAGILPRTWPTRRQRGKAMVIHHRAALAHARFGTPQFRALIDLIKP